MSPACGMRKARFRTEKLHLTLTATPAGLERLALCLNSFSFSIRTVALQKRVRKCLKQMILQPLIEQDKFLKKPSTLYSTFLNELSCIYSFLLCWSLSIFFPLLFPSLPFPSPLSFYSLSFSSLFSFFLFPFSLLLLALPCFLWSVDSLILL